MVCAEPDNIVAVAVAVGVVVVDAVAIVVAVVVWRFDSMSHIQRSSRWETSGQPQFPCRNERLGQKGMFFHPGVPAAPWSNDSLRGFSL